MTQRKVHLRPKTVVWTGTTRTFCGKTLYMPRGDMKDAVVDFGGLEATVHGALVTCAKCIPGTHHGAMQPAE